MMIQAAQQKAVIFNFLNSGTTPPAFPAVSVVDLVTGKTVEEISLQHGLMESEYVFDSAGQVRVSVMPGDRALFAPLAGLASSTLQNVPSNLTPTHFGYTPLWGLRGRRFASPLTESAVSFHCSRKSDSRTGLCHVDSRDGRFLRFTAIEEFPSPKDPFLDYVQRSRSGLLLAQCLNGGSKPIVHVANTVDGRTLVKFPLHQVKEYCPNAHKMTFSQDESHFVVLDGNEAVVQELVGAMATKRIPLSAFTHWTSLSEVDAYLLRSKRCLAITRPTDNAHNLTSLLFLTNEAKPQAVAWVEPLKYGNYVETYYSFADQWDESADGTQLFTGHHSDGVGRAFAIKRFDVPVLCR